MDRKIAELRAPLLRWYRRSSRDLPWRRTRDPYAIWVAEVMLQQTQVATVVPYYRRFMTRFPDPASLAAASEEEVLAVTGYARGAVAPFGLPQPLRILVDASVFARPELSLGSGVRGTAIILSRANLKRALGDVEVGQFT